MREILSEISQSIIDGDKEHIEHLIRQAIEEGLSAEEILNNGLIVGMDVISTMMNEGEMFLPEVLICAKTMQVASNLLKPLLIQENAANKGKVLIGTVAGDLHDIGKKIVAMMLEGAGFEVIDLGVDVPQERFLSALRETQASFVCMSAMLTTTMPEMGKVINNIKEAGLYERVRIMVGGAPITEDFAKKIGAHYAFDAATAVMKTNELCQSLC